MHALTSFGPLHSASLQVRLPYTNLGGANGELHSFFGLPSRFLSPYTFLDVAFLVRYVLCHTDDVLHPPLRVPDWKTAIPDPTDFTVLPHDTIFVIEVDPTLLPRDVVLNALTIVWMNRLEKRFMFIVETLTRTAPHSFICRTNVDDLLGFDVGHPKDLADGLRDQTEAFITQLTGSFGPVPLNTERDVVRYRGQGRSHVVGNWPRRKQAHDADHTVVDDERMRGQGG